MTPDMIPSVVLAIIYPVAVLALLCGALALPGLLIRGAVR